MKNMLEKPVQVLLPFVAILLLMQCATAQEVLAAQGGFASTPNMLYTFTVGESLISTLNNPVVLVTQGFQQPDKLTVDVQEAFAPFQIRAFPNPTADAVTVTFEGPMLQFSLYDNAGRQLTTIGLKQSEQQVEVSFAALPAGIYLLRAVAKSGEIVGSIRIIKQ